MRFFAIAIFVLFTGFAKAQDVQLSQFYASPLYLNPGFAGSAHLNRLATHQRLQWPGLEAKYITSLFSFDTYSTKYKSGFGVMLMQDYQGGNTLTSTEITLQYSYELHISKKYTLRPGLQYGFASRSINYAEFRFPNQFNNEKGFDNSISSGGEFGADRISYSDLSSGAVFYSEKLWVGISAHHINQPNQSFNGEVAKLPAKYSLVGGYKIPLSKNKYQRANTTSSITPAMHYKLQGKSDQLDLGVYGTYKQLIAGFWYRGIPVKKYLPKLHNSESMVALVGWKYNGLSFGYSYDFTVSRLSVARPWGAHELNITYVHYKKRKKMRSLPCPNIYDK